MMFRFSFVYLIFCYLAFISVLGFLPCLRIVFPKICSHIYENSPRASRVPKVDGLSFSWDWH